jgi:hypothetical protein
MISVGFLNTKLAKLSVEIEHLRAELKRIGFWSGKKVELEVIVLSKTQERSAVQKTIAKRMLHC